MTPATVLSRLAWLARRALRLRPHTAAEEVWRLRFLRGRPPKTPGKVSWRHVPLHYADAPALLGQLEDIFVRGVYDFAPAHSAPRILDCGAHVGVAVLHWREQFPLAAITAFEADPEIAGRLRQNLAARGDTLTRIQPAAAWIADGRIGFHRTGSDNGHVSSAATDSVAALDLGAFCREPVDLLKLDIEGAEGRVLAHLHATGALRNIRRLVCEWHEWSSESPALHLALSLLAADGFLYRIAHAGCLGASPCPAFPRIGWPGNHLLIYAWQDSGTTPAP